MDQNLVFDVGLHNGDDAAYYLRLGYRVVGIEANPLLAHQCRLRFCSEIREGRIAVINAGILSEPGTFTFYRNLSDDGWSSFEPERGRRGGKWEEMRIACITTRQVIMEHGQPSFMKVDIEGADLQALNSLEPATAPAYVSVELNHTDPILERLIDLGYSAFKFVDGETYRPTAPIFDHQPCWRLLRKAGRVAPFIRNAVSKLPQHLRAKSEWNPPGKYSPEHYPFTKYSSCPFGEQAAGQWMTSKAALRWFGAMKNDYRRAGMEHTLWWDVHARHSSAQEHIGTRAKGAGASVTTVS